MTTDALSKNQSKTVTQISKRLSERISIQQFLDGMAEHASNLPIEQKQQVDERLELARVLIGSTDPLDCFLAWKAPLERNQRKYDDMKKASQAD